MNIRPFNYDSESDYEAIVNIGNAIWFDDPTTVQNRRHWDTVREEKYRFNRVVLENGNGIIAYGGCGDREWSFEPGKFFLGIEVHPQYQGQGYGAQLYTHLFDQLERWDPETVSITSGTREDQVRAIRFLEDRGFKQVMRFCRSSLDVQAFDPGRFADKVARVEEKGIALKNMAQLSAEVPDWKRKWYDLEVELGKDVPYHDEFTPWEFETFKKGIFGSPNYYPEAIYVGVDGDRWVGISALWRNTGSPQKLGTGLTGVVRTHRRLGLATALKTKALSFAQEHGYTAIETDNEENNPMYQINLQLGFRPIPAGLDFVKEF